MRAIMRHRLPVRPLTRPARFRLIAGACCAAAALAVVHTAAPKFYPDDPLTRVPETQDASGAAPWDIDLFYDLSYNLFVTATQKPEGVRAQNLNTIGEVPDSSWFTNRIGSRPMTVDELVRGPVTGPAPVPESWTVTREKSSGAAAGFTAKDANGETWFISFDAPANPEGATAALVIATKLFWALGYNQVEYFLTDLDPSRVQVSPDATTRRPSGERTPLTKQDVNAVLERADRGADGTYRAAAGRLLPGKVLGGFKYRGTRPDDPNDLVPHEHRRELRALRVFGAWTNLTDMKAGNTLDTIVTENGRGIVRHYLQDVGSTFGVGAAGAHDWSEGWEYLYDGSASMRRLVTFGFAMSPWQKARYERHAAVGRFEGETFDPTTWVPRVPTAAYIEMQDDDAFWAARRVMAFTDELIRGVVKAGGLSNPDDERYLADVLIKRRDSIGRAYLTRINPVVTPILDASGTLAFGNAAVQYGFATAPDRYTAVWSTFDNATGATAGLGETSGTEPRLAAPSGLPSAPGAFVRVELSARHSEHGSWGRPVHLYFRRAASGWALVGFERLPQLEAGSPTTGPAR
jgi:hypothetical protein